MTAEPATALYRTPERPIPVYVAVLAILIGVAGMVLLILSVLVLVSAPPAVRPFAVFGASPIGGMLLLVFAVLLLVVASGLWYLELWAFILSIVLVGLLWIAIALNGNLVSLPSLVFFGLLVYLVASYRAFR
jgi:hypothetical protein